METINILQMIKCILKSLLENFWTILASIAAIFSAIYAYRSNRLSKSALQIANQSYQDKQANFNLYLIDGFRWTEESTKRKFLFFHCTIKNKSENKSTYKATLEIEYIRNDNSVSRLILDHEPYLKEFIPQQTLTIFPVNIRIEEKGMESKWLIFEQPDLVLKEYRIEKYSIKVSDTSGNSESTNCFILKEMRNED
jgi:hypothetical protein